LAIEFEVRANPAWPMPAAARCLESLAAGGRVLGIISNAQFFTPLLFPATLGKTLDELGFDARLRYYSYEHQRAKPSTWLYERAAEQLAKLGIRAADTLYVGNDIRNDVWPATRVGFRTVLFAGDRRSLRLRTEDRATAERDVGAAGYPPPDAVVTDLAQIAQLVG
jgi:putative hydrolase of the HAD superfamily